MQDRGGERKVWEANIFAVYAISLFIDGLLWFYFWELWMCVRSVGFSHSKISKNIINKIAVY